MRRFLFSALLCSALLLPHAAGAADVCCACRGPSETEDTCLTVGTATLGYQSCSQLPSLVGSLMNGWTCKPEEVGAKCKSVAENGICVKGPLDSFAIAPPSESVAPANNSTNASEDKQIIPNLNVAIPGFSFRTGDAKGTSSLLAQYIAGVYGYLLSIVAVAATIMFTYGAFQYLIGSALPSIQRGKQIMQDAILGMLMVFGAVLIFRTINPDTLSLSALYIQGVNPVFIGGYRADVIPSEGQLVGLTGKPSNAEEQILAGARMVAGVDPCAVLAICQTESGLRPLWSGQLSGGSAQAAHAWGPCQQATQYLTDKNPWTALAQGLFPDFPSAISQDTPAERIRMGQYLNTHYVAAGFIAALNFKSNVGYASNNEIAASAAYYSGVTSLKKWRDANGCKPQPGVTLKNADSGNLLTSCIPEFVAVAGKGAPPPGCPEDKYVCPNATQDKTAQFSGRCSNPSRLCYAARVGSYTRTVINNYRRFASKFNCTASATNATAAPSIAITSARSGRAQLQQGDKVLLIGDSLSVGLTAPLGSLIRKAGFGFLNGPGEVGSLIPQWAPGGSLHGRLVTGLAAKPKVVLISLGTNDEYTYKTAQTVETDMQKLDALVAEIQSAGASVYWIGPPLPLPDNYGGRTGNSPGGLVTPAIKNRIPSSNYFLSEQLTLPRSDGLHPTGAGYSQWADAIWGWLQ